jgi:hypothetical protein
VRELTDDKSLEKGERKRLQIEHADGFQSSEAGQNRRQNLQRSRHYAQPTVGLVTGTSQLVPSLE